MGFIFNATVLPITSITFTDQYWHSPLTWFLCDITAPFENPVVPEVKRMNAGSWLGGSNVACSMLNGTASNVQGGFVIRRY